MPYGSRAEYTEPRDELKQMKRKTRESGNFPKVGRSSLETTQKELEKIQQEKELNAIQQRRVALDNRMTYELDMERQMADLRRARMPGLRGQGARTKGSSNVAEEVLTG